MFSSFPLRQTAFSNIVFSRRTRSCLHDIGEQDLSIYAIFPIHVLDAQKYILCNQQTEVILEQFQDCTIQTRFYNGWYHGQYVRKLFLLNQKVLLSYVQ